MFQHFTCFLLFWSSCCNLGEFLFLSRKSWSDRHFKVFDVTRKVTYLNLKTWYSEMREHCPNIPCILVANKIDADRSSTEKTFKFAEKYNLPFYFVSAADGTNVVKVMNRTIKFCYLFSIDL